MKQLKFRVWIKPQKEMLPVIDLHWGYDGELESCLIEGTSKNDYGDTERGIYVPITECELMQFTGLYDVNGKEIYEFDFLKQKSTNEVFLINHFTPINRNYAWATRIGFLDEEKNIIDREYSETMDNDWASWSETYEIIGNSCQIEPKILRYRNDK